MIPSEQASDGLNPSFYLDCGADEDLACPGFHLSERGMRFESRWQFDIGTQLAVALHYQHPRLGHQRVTIEGIVVWCEPTPQKRFESTLLFLELPDELKPSLREFSHLTSAASSE